MTKTPAFALMAVTDLPETSGDGDVPEWIHLVPAGKIETVDGRGPYEIGDAQAVIDASFAVRGPIEIDENHASFKGGAAPACGWIEAMEARADGIWGHVSWTDHGRDLVATRAYRRISPALGLAAKGSKTVVSILNAALVNRNNLRGLVALNQEIMGMDMQAVLAKLKQMLGLAPDAEDDEIWRSLSAVIDAAAAEKAQKASMGALQSEMAEIGRALGCAEDADGKIVLGAAMAAAAAGGEGGSVAALQAELTEVRSELTELKDKGARKAAETYVDGAIAEGRPGVSKSRDRWISMHMSDPEGTEVLIAGIPAIGGTSHTRNDPPPSQDGTISLNAEQLQVQRQLGLDPEAFAATLEKERAAQQETA